MPSFCPDCHSDMITCRNCGRVLCSGGCNGNFEHVDTPVAHGNYCVRCLGGPTKIHEDLRAYSRSVGSPNALVLKSPEKVQSEFEERQFKRQEEIARQAGLPVINITNTRKQY